ncbi:hypothetical protein [Glycomyces buryatensis]|uniref:Uncharacterized protein n=1 Tax=Glycomyces buryatensis TaxID=2570927 RepID=A0A4S8Q7X1_9ACTN|nr:hypothetical protein [Glycomyces buryatensis]THV39451.1 hypothetical protein FAB82_17695 [Glycomyces buryatensis]
MNIGLRVLLHLFQVLLVLAALGLLAAVFASEFDMWDLSEREANIFPLYAIGTGVLSIAFSPSLWSLSRGGGSAPARASTGSFDRVSEAPAGPVQQPGPLQQPSAGGPNSFEPLGGGGAPAPPASSYGQPSGPGFGAQPSAGMTPASPPQGDSPWGGSR